MKTLALIVSYNGEKTICSALNSCLTDERLSDLSLLIIDNASTDSTIAAIQSLNLNQLNIIQMPHNVGVATAYNLGLKKAQELGAKWLFLLDQDSVCLHCCLNHLLEEANLLEKQGKPVGAVCANIQSWFFPDCIHFPYYWKGNSLVTAHQSIESSSGIVIPIDSSLSSGTLYNVEALGAIGGFREDYFIDFVDHECHIRLHQAGWKLWWHKHAILYHRLGIFQKMTDDGLWIEHQPYRYYYMARNMFEGLRRLGGKPAAARFVKQDLFGHIQRLWRYGKSPLKSSFFLIRGIIDGFLGRMGPR